VKFLTTLNVLVALCSGLIGGVSTGLTWVISTLIDLIVGRVPLVAVIAATILINSFIIGGCMFWVGHRHGLQTIEDSGDGAESPAA
jgi:hypothetical protein